SSRARSRMPSAAPLGRGSASSDDPRQAAFDHRECAWSSSQFEQPFNDDRRSGKPHAQYVRRSSIVRRTERPMDRQKSEDVIGGARPFTGAQYLESLRDGREVYVYGERVKDVTTHPAFRNAARSVARLYDALHDARTREVLTSPTDTGSGEFTHKFFRVARAREDVVGQRDAIAAWARMSYGWRGRPPD